MSKKKDDKDGKVATEVVNDRRQFLKNVGGASMVMMSLSLIRNVKDSKAQPQEDCQPSHPASIQIEETLLPQGFTKVECCRTPIGSAEAIIHIYKQTDNRLASLFEILDGEEVGAFGGIFEIQNWETLEGTLDLMSYDSATGELITQPISMADVVDVLAYPDPFRPEISSGRSCTACAACAACAGCLTDGIMPDLEGLGLGGLAGLIALASASPQE